MARQFPKVGLAMRSRFRLSEFREVHPLASAVHRQLGIPVSELPDTLADVRRGGADSGFPGFTYYADTVSFAKRHRAAILDSLVSLADDLGEGKGITAAVRLVSGFRCVKDSRVSEESILAALLPANDRTQLGTEHRIRSTGGGRPRQSVPAWADADEVDTVRNALAWYVLEEVASRAESLTA